jgi:hypothetical protein
MTRPERTTAETIDHEARAIVRDLNKTGTIDRRRLQAHYEHVLGLVGAGHPFPEGLAQAALQPALLVETENIAARITTNGQDTEWDRPPAKGGKPRTGDGRKRPPR